MRLKISFICFVIFGCIILPEVAFMQDAGFNDQFGAFAGDQGAQFGEPEDPRTVAGNIITMLMGLLGIIFLAYTLYGGFLIMTSAGREEAVKKGRSTITTGIIGLAVLLSAWAIATFAFRLASGGQQDDGFSAECIPGREIGRDPLGQPILEECEFFE